MIRVPAACSFFSPALLGRAGAKTRPRETGLRTGKLRQRQVKGMLAECSGKGLGTETVNLGGN